MFYHNTLDFILSLIFHNFEGHVLTLLVPTYFVIDSAYVHICMVDNRIFLAHLDVTKNYLTLFIYKCSKVLATQFSYVSNVLFVRDSKINY